ncbi:hypothetical protein ZOSMA_169G00050 [Zostera marina]|uniref:Uncharacterized protein n=1 Tax=Zostera marina TaxID=29655 RepID=A0A0K9PVG7_ZOSMR|nr:hypothetical protein ZOSMA_169G00050 [Zostera marina]
MIQIRIQPPKQLATTNPNHFKSGEGWNRDAVLFLISLSFFLSYSNFCSSNFWKRAMLCQSNLLQQFVV